MDLSPIPILDHHAHPLWRKEAVSTPAGFRRWFSESNDETIRRRHIEQTLFLSTGLQWLAELLDCAPTLEAVVAARNAQPEASWAQRLLGDANIQMLLLDYGYGSAEAYDHTQMQALLPACRILPILRLETTAETLIRTHDSLERMTDAFVATAGRARQDGYVSLKSIIAYRSGLVVTHPGRDEVAADFLALREQVKREGRVRLVQKALCDYLLHLALAEAQKQALPVQFHTGFGDADADLRTANPLHLRAVIEAYPAVQMVLLHGGWPYYRELAHLAALYGNVWLDLSLAVPFATSGIPTMLREVLGMAPLSKVMFATDAFTMPEIFWLAARWGRWGLGRVLDEFVAERWLTPDQALAAAEAILGDTARQLYQL